jgi:hypothetical protein
VEDSDITLESNENSIDENNDSRDTELSLQRVGELNTMDA